MKRDAARLKRFDIAGYLKSPEDAAVYLSQVTADGDDAERRRALGHLSRARGSEQGASAAATATQEFLRITAGSKARTERKISRDKMHERR